MIDGCEYSGEDETSDQRVEQDASHVEEDCFEGIAVGDSNAGVLAEEGGADKGDGGGADDAQQHPRDTDAATGACFFSRAQGHEADDNVRLPKIAQAPCEVADDGGQTNPTDHGEVRGVADAVGVGAVIVVAGPSENAGGVFERQQCHDRHDQQCEEHDHALHGVSGRDCEEAADEGVGDGDCSDDEHAVGVGTAEGRFEVLAAGDHAGGYVEGEEHQNDQRADDAQHAAFVVQSVFDEARQGDGVVGDLGVGAQARGDPFPVGPTTNQQADGDPQL